MPSRSTKTPEYAVIRELYMYQNMSYRDIGERFNVDVASVYRRAKNEAIKRDHEWPMVPVRAHTQGRAGRARCDSVDARMVKAELEEAAESLSMQYKDIAVKAGLHPQLVYNLTAGIRTRIARSTAEKIMTAIQELETAKNRRDNAANGLKARQAKIAARKAAV